MSIEYNGKIENKKIKDVKQNPNSVKEILALEEKNSNKHGSLWSFFISTYFSGSDLSSKLITY